MTLHSALRKSIHNLSRALQILLLSACAVTLARAQAEKAGPDVLIFTDGEKLTGHFVQSTDASVTFKTDALGELTVDWSKVKELQTSAHVAVIRKGVKLSRKEGVSNVPQGTLAEQDQKLQITPAPGTPPVSIPVTESSVVVDQSAFQKAMTRKAGFFSDWNGGITAGATIVEATQNNRTFTAAVNLVRAEPTEAWLNPSSKTIVTFLESYGELTQPETPSIKTSIIHGGIEHDRYLSPSLFAFGQADFDHNYSQGLDLQQTYAGGLGWTVFKTPIQELDLKASMAFIRQQFLAGPDGFVPPSKNLVGSVFGETYHRKLPRSWLFDQSLTFTPAWNDTSAYSALFSALLTVPVYKHISGSIGVVDTYLNNPPDDFKKNSFQLVLGVTYSFR